MVIGRPGDWDKEPGMRKRQHRHKVGGGQAEGSSLGEMGRGVSAHDCMILSRAWNGTQDSSVSSFLCCQQISGKMFHSPLVLVLIKDNLHLESVPPLAQVAEVSVMELKVTTLLLKHVGISMIPHDGIVFHFLF